MIDIDAQQIESMVQYDCHGGAPERNWNQFYRQKMNILFNHYVPYIRQNSRLEISAESFKIFKRQGTITILKQLYSERNSYKIHHCH